MEINGLNYKNVSKKVFHNFFNKYPKGISISSPLSDTRNVYCGYLPKTNRFDMIAFVDYDYDFKNMKKINKKYFILDQKVKLDNIYNTNVGLKIRCNNKKEAIEFINEANKHRKEKIKLIVE